MLKKLLGAAAVVILVIVVVQLTTPSPSQAPAPNPTVVRASVVTPQRSLPTVQTSRCQRVSPALLASIADGLTVFGNGSLSDGMAVKSADFSNVYFVAARINGPGMDRTVGLWATNNLQGNGMIFSVDAFAREFSDWPDGSQSTARLSKSDDGAREAIACVP